MGQADAGISLAGNMALGLLKSQWLKDAPKDIWIKVWDCFVATRSELDTETFCRLCCKSIAKELKEEKRTIIFKELLTERMVAFLIKNFPEELFCMFDTVFSEPDEQSEEVRIIAKERLDWLLDEEKDNAAESDREKLGKFQDVRNHQTRKKMVKCCDSNSSIERCKAMNDLIIASFVTPKV